MPALTLIVTLNMTLLQSSLPHSYLRSSNYRWIMAICSYRLSILAVSVLHANVAKNVQSYTFMSVMGRQPWLTGLRLLYPVVYTTRNSMQRPVAFAPGCFPPIAPSYFPSQETHEVLAPRLCRRPHRHVKSSNQETKLRMFCPVYFFSSL